MQNKPDHILQGKEWEAELPEMKRPSQRIGMKRQRPNWQNKDCSLPQSKTDSL